MPNWIANTLKITTKDEKQTAEILAAFKGKRTNGDEADFTFNALIPMPDYIYRGNLGQEEIKKYGKNNWYDWSCHNWGTKWDMREAKAEVCENTINISFFTAWDCPVPILDVLGIKFPDADITCIFDDCDDWQGICGKIHIHLSEGISEGKAYTGEEGLIFSLALNSSSIEEEIEANGFKSLEEYCDRFGFSAEEIRKAMTNIEEYKNMECISKNAKGE